MQQPLDPITWGTPISNTKHQFLEHPKDRHFDCIVVGAGPAGAASAIHIARTGRRVLLVDKEVFPRNKTCGDAIGGKALLEVEKLGAKQAVDKNPFLAVTGITFSSPKGDMLSIPLPTDEVRSGKAGYTVPRRVFDHTLASHAASIIGEDGGCFLQGWQVTSLIHDNSEGGKDPGPNSGDGRRCIGVKIRKQNEEKEVEVLADLVVGAGGYLCPVAKTLINETYNETLVDESHYCASYRQYWRGVAGMETNIEIHFMKDVIPGYLWVFPLPDGLVNLGIGMLVSETKKRNINLKAMMQKAVDNNPILKQRFEGAELVSTSGRGWQLPFGSKRKGVKYQPRRAFGNGILLVGDSASLVDPFSGEGVGNALRSAAKVGKLLTQFPLGKGTGLTEGKAYQNSLQELVDEMANSYRLQKLTKKKWLLNWFVKKATKRPALRQVLTDMLESKEEQGAFHSKWFILRSLIF